MQHVLIRNLHIIPSRKFCENSFEGNFPQDLYLSDSFKHADMYAPISPKVSWFIQGNGELWKQKEEDGSPPSFITILRQDYFK